MADSTALPTALAGSSAEAQAAAFADDDRIHFDRTTGTWRLEDDDGNEMEYDAAKGVWVPVVSAHTTYSHPSNLRLTRYQLSDELVKAQQAAYAVEGVDEEASHCGTSYIPRD